ncbi:hypothetical protein D3C76_910680 [compost metagenome]
MKLKSVYGIVILTVSGVTTVTYESVGSALQLLSPPPQSMLYLEATVASPVPLVATALENVT